MRNLISTYLMAGTVLILIISSLLAPKLETFATLVFTGLTLLTVFIYTMYTRNMVEEETKARKLEYKERQLKHFYYPAVKFIKEANRARKEISYEEADYGYVVIAELLSHITIENLEEIDKYQFYANSKIQELLEELHKYSRIYEDNVRYIYENQREIEKTWSDFIIEIDNDIEMLKGDINKLVND